MAQTPGPSSLERRTSNHEQVARQRHLGGVRALGPSSRSGRLEQGSQRNLRLLPKALTPPRVISRPSPASGPLHLQFPLLGPGSRPGWFLLSLILLSDQLSRARPSRGRSNQRSNFHRHPKLSLNFTFLMVLI